jgi:hypothetical protein
MLTKAAQDGFGAVMSSLQSIEKLLGRALQAGGSSSSGSSGTPAALFVGDEE